MIRLQTPRGLDVDVPETVDEDPSPRFSIQSLGDIKRYYEDNGYVIVENVISRDNCEYIRNLWNAEVRPFQGFMYRQATARAEKHEVNQNGWIMNPILNLQSLDPRYFFNFRNYASNHILSNARLRGAFEALLNDGPTIVQSMYFEGNSATWEHQDSYYLDSEITGKMTAAWIALEDIAARAGRFFICPGSHRIKLDDHGLSNNIAENHDRYISSVVEKIRENNLEIRAPVMRRGDVLFWNAWTIHGSLDSQDANQSRSSITCHAIPQGRKFRQLQLRTLDIKTDAVNGVRIFRPKDLSKPLNRLILFVESSFPRLFYWAKKTAILALLKRKAARAGVN